ncbi:Icc family phosphohydrolase, partial [gut metagenome]
WKSVIAIFEGEKVPFSVVMGNHDGEMLPKSDIYDLLLQSSYFIGENGVENIHGVGNHVVPVYSSDGKSRAALLYCFDSNDYPTVKDYGTYDWIHFDQVAWYREQSARFTKENGGKPLPALAFFHIPLLEYNDVMETGTVLGHK